MQILVSLAVLTTITLLSARQFGQMSNFMASFNSGKDAAALQDDLRRLLADPLLCQQAIQIPGGQFLENSKELPILIGGEKIAAGVKPTRYSLREASVKVISSREMFQNANLSERVWSFDLDLVATRTSGEALKPRALGTIFLRFNRVQQVDACSLESRSLMRCQANEILQMNSEKGIYQCLSLAELAKNPINCPPGMKLDPSSGGTSCTLEDRTGMQVRAIQFSKDMQGMLKDPSKLLDPESYKKIMNTMQEQLKDVCLQAGGHWTGSSCEQ